MSDKLICACGAVPLNEDSLVPSVYGPDGNVHEPDTCWRPCRGECGNKFVRKGDLCHRTHPLDGRIIASLRNQPAPRSGT